MRGKGLLNAIVIKEEGGVNAYDVCMKLKDSGLLVSGTLKAHLLNKFDRLDADMSIIKTDTAFQHEREACVPPGTNPIWSSSTVLCIPNNVNSLVLILGVQLIRSLRFNCSHDLHETCSVVLPQ